MRFLAGALGTAAVLVGCYLLMWRGWRNRQRRQAGIAEPLKPPAGFDPTERFDGVYVATTTAGDWLDRIAVHGLGVRSDACLEVAAAGVAFRRTGAPDLFVPAAQVLAVRTDRGIAGKVTAESSGLVIIGWRHDQRDFDTGFRPRHKHDTARLTESVEALIPNGVTQ